MTAFLTFAPEYQLQIFSSSGIKTELVLNGNPKLFHDYKLSVGIKLKLHDCVRDIRPDVNSSQSSTLEVTQRRTLKSRFSELAVSDSMIMPLASASTLRFIFEYTMLFRQYCLKSTSAAALHIGALPKINNHLSRYFLVSYARL